MRLPALNLRLVLGVVLILAAVLGVVSVVLNANRTVTVYAAPTPLAAGTAVSINSLARVDVHVGTPTNLYLTPSNGDGEIVITRPIGAGEFIPMSALGEPDAGIASVVVPLTGSIPASVGVGTDVAVWVARPGEKSGTYAASQVLVESAHVVRVVEDERMIGKGGVQLELRIPISQVSAVLDAIANGSQLQVVPLHTPMQAGSGN